eukprot:6213036-Pleurochrysis_carterae.AAC.2
MPNPSEIALNVTPLAKVNIEEYYLAVNSNLHIGGLCILLVTHGCVLDLFLLPLILRNHARYIPNKGCLIPGNAYFHIGHSVQSQARIATFVHFM